MQGKIIKGIAGFYLVDCGGEVLTCKARGLFRKQGEKPLVGDLAEVEAAQTSESEANIVTLLPRKNRLIRPAVSNVDQALVVMAVRTPDPQFYLLDQYLVTMELQEIPAAILFTKEDLDRGELADYRSRYEAAGYPVFSVSAENGSGLEALRAHLAGKTTVLRSLWGRKVDAHEFTLPCGEHGDRRAEPQEFARQADHASHRALLPRREQLSARHAGLYGSRGMGRYGGIQTGVSGNPGFGGTVPLYRL